MYIKNLVKIYKIYIIHNILFVKPNNPILMFFSDEDTDIKNLVNSWLKRQDERSRDVLSGWIEDHFYDALQLALRSVCVVSCFMFYEILVQTTILKKSALV